MSLRIVNWNVQFATPRSWRSPEILDRIDRHGPEIVCLTETHDELLAQGGHAICSQADYGYALKPNRRKVLLWSKEPWRQVDDLGVDFAAAGDLCETLGGCVDDPQPRIASGAGSGPLPQGRGRKRRWRWRGCWFPGLGCRG